MRCETGRLWLKATVGALKSLNYKTWFLFWLWVDLVLEKGQKSLLFCLIFGGNKKVKEINAISRVQLWEPGFLTGVNSKIYIQILDKEENSFREQGDINCYVYITQIQNHETMKEEFPQNIKYRWHFFKKITKKLHVCRNVV